MVRLMISFHFLAIRLKSLLIPALVGEQPVHVLHALAGGSTTAAETAGVYQTRQIRPPGNICELINNHSNWQHSQPQTAEHVTRRIERALSGEDHALVL